MTGKRQRPESDDAVARARAAFAEKYARLTAEQKSPKSPAAASQNGNNDAPGETPGVASPGVKLNPDLQRRIDEAKARAAARVAAAARNQEQERLAEAHSKDAAVGARGGLGVGLHPALAGESLLLANKKNSTRSKFATTIANQKGVPQQKFVNKSKQLELISGPGEDFTDREKNPYFDHKLGGRDTTRPADRRSKILHFNEPGRFIEKANQIRNEESLKELRARIEANTKRLGLEDDLEISGRAIAKQEPPEIEWWDQDYTTSNSYQTVAYGRMKIETSDSPITAMIQHPIPIPAPADLNDSGPAPLMYTKKEQKKIRKQEREAKQKDKQDKQRLGLIPPEAPKVKLSNMATVLANSTSQDPTKVEQEVRKQVQARIDAHEQANLARKLTKEEKSAKALRKLQEDELKGVHASAWRVETLRNAYHRRRIDENAQQCGLTGVVILNPRFSLVYVEGGRKSVAFFKKLVEGRIVWTDPPRTSQRDPDAVAGAEDEDKEEEAVAAQYETNRATWVWDGSLKKRIFSAFRYHTCPTEGDVKELLGARGNALALWNIAKQIKEE